MSKIHRALTAILAIAGLIALVGLADAQGKAKGKEDAQGKAKVKEDAQDKGKVKDTEKTEKTEKAKGKHQHLSGPQLVGDKIKTPGKHVIDQRGKFTSTATVKNGKIAGINVKHSEKGEVHVTKYKTKRKMAANAGEADGIFLASYHHGLLAQVQDLGTTYIGYAYIDDYGEEVIYWFPVEMIYDGDTGAIDYVPLD